jgi:uncharacterized protein YigA (DUF484 family)
MGLVMTKIVEIDFKRSKSFAAIGFFDAMVRDAQAVVDTRLRIRKFLAAEPRTLEEADKLIAKLQALRPSELGLSEIASQIEDGLQRATPEQIREQLTLLLGTFPASNALDPVVYSRMMLHEVMAAGPSVIALTFACSELRRSLQWPPSIAAVLKAIGEQKERWQYRLRCASVAIEEHRQALSRLTSKRAWLSQPDSERVSERMERLTRLEALKQHLMVVKSEDEVKHRKLNLQRPRRRAGASQNADVR